MTEATAGQGIPVARLPSRLGRRWVRRSRVEKIPDQPVVHLLRENDPGRLVDQLSDHLGSVVPHVVLDVGGAPADSQRGKSVQIRKLLDRAALGLRDADSWPRIGRLRFRRYALLSWLLKKNLPPTNLARAPHSDIRHLLREYLSSRRPRRTQQEEQLEAQGWELAAQNLPWYLYLLSLVFFPVYYGWWVRKGRVARWFMRQRYLSPNESADFPSFAQRLITTPSRWENAKQVRKLLVHAFLADLADSYNRRLWRWKWVPKDCYPVLLLRNLRDESVGKMLVRLINDVRNETGVPDPLLVIGSGAEPLADSETPSAPVTLETWHETLQEARRKRSNTAWYVTLRVADEPPVTDDEPGVSLGQTSLPLKHSKMLRRVPIALGVLLLIGGGAAYYQQYEYHCGRSLWPWTNSDLWTADGECVGIADADYRFSSGVTDAGLRARLDEAQEAINAQNEEAAKKTELPHITIVYFSTLTGVDADSTTLDGVAAELEGLAKAQEFSRRNNQAAIRIVIANGGARMGHAAEVAEHIVEYAAQSVPENPADERALAENPPVVSVVGLGGSWEGTKEAIRTLGGNGLSMVATVPSADELPSLSRLYYQVGPTNSWQAEIIAQHIRNLGVDRVTVYSPEADLYSRNLAEDIEAQPGIAVQLADTVSAENLHCSPDSLVFFAGRADKFGAFRTTVQETCTVPGSMPRIMAGDDTTKYLFDNDLPVGFALDYVDFTGHRVRGEADGVTGRGMLAYDAVGLVRQAVKRTLEGQDPGGTQLNGQAVWYGIVQLGQNPGGIGAISGHLDFRSPTGQLQQVPHRKAISVMRVVGTAPDDPARKSNTQVLMYCGDPREQIGRCPP
ncbi:ABC transporter substrate-binding protein [Saccharopolyspora hirsuta]|uniref:Uncharacterized protein n=1 Tax=Saccharopolyspora hirsuta TaxID=1837 RepID=A0A5M7BC57_SACHI|nr:ABC transporter substrate-binding protein [Saccharopolyspora hirsuta]KAA5825858.1 hypothetical protein F1721_32390 [Saccharopolyspora hirsuta]